MNRKLANMSTDFRRISYWIYQGKDDLASRMIARAKKTYKINSPVGPYKDVWKEVDSVKNLTGGRLVAADRASTISSILLQESFKSK